MTAKNETQRIEAKLRQQSGVSEPWLPGHCWALKRVYTGALFPSFVNCMKAARSGHLTCRWHAEREQDAQDLKHAGMEQTND